MSRIFPHAPPIKVLPTLIPVLYCLLISMSVLFILSCPQDIRTRGIPKYYSCKAVFGHVSVGKVIVPEDSLGISVLFVYSDLIYIRIRLHTRISNSIGCSGGPVSKQSFKERHGMLALTEQSQTILIFQPGILDVQVSFRMTA